MRRTLTTFLSAITGAALLCGAALTAVAEPHGGHGGAPGAGSGPRGGAPAFARPRGGTGFAGPRGGFDAGRMAREPRGGFNAAQMAGGPRGERMAFSPAWRGPRGSFEAPRAARGRSAFASNGDVRGFGRGRGGAPAVANARAFAPRGRALAGMPYNGIGRAPRAGPFSVARNGFPAPGFRGAPQAFNGPLGFGDERARSGFPGWRGDRGFDWDDPDFDWDDVFWPIGFGVAVDWSLGYPPCPYWDGWRCRWTYPAAYPGPGYYWGPGYYRSPAYAWDVGYAPGPGYAVGYDRDAAPAYATAPAVYAVWTPDDPYIDDQGGCASRHWVWDPVLGGYVLRRDYDDCWS
jgi:hypothetical protein